MVFIFSSINGASRTLNLNLIFMVLNLLCCKILCIYFHLNISVSKSSHIVDQYIFLIAYIQPYVVLTMFLIFWQSEPHLSQKICSYFKKSVHGKKVIARIVLRKDFVELSVMQGNLIMVIKFQMVFIIKYNSNIIGNGNPTSAWLKLKGQRFNTGTFYWHFFQRR